MSKDKNIEESKKTFTKDDAFQTLNIISSWISNIDTKVSFALALAGILIGSTFGEELPKSFEKILNAAKFSDINSIEIISSIVVVLLYISSFLSILFFVLAIIARAKTRNYFSLFFFGTINDMNLKEYQKSVNKLNEEELLLDLEKQIHINSKICCLKIKLYNIGMYFLISTIILWFVCMIFKLL